MTKTLSDIRSYLDDLLKPASSADSEGNGLLVEGSPTVRRLGAALNTSFWSINAAAAASVDLLLVHHAPWTEIDLHLRDQKLVQLRELSIGLYAAHDTLDRAPHIDVGRQFVQLIGLDADSEHDDLIVAR